MQALCNIDGELDVHAFERLIRHQLQVTVFLLNVECSSLTANWSRRP